MQAEAREILARLLTHQPVLALAVLIRGRPYVGQLPFAVWRERGSPLVHVSSLARHSRGLQEGAPFGALIGGAGEDPFQIPRLSLEGTVHRLDPGDEEYAAARALYLARLPSAARHFQLGGFTLIELQVERGRLVTGFAGTYNLTASHLRQPAT